VRHLRGQEMLLPVAGLLLLLAACATSRTAPDVVPTQRDVDADVFYRAIEPQDVERHVLRREEDFHLGTPMRDQRVTPDYPAQFLHSAPARVEICAQAHVDASGAVFGTAVETGSGACPEHAPEIDAAFRAATHAALRQWRFEPSYRCTLRDGERRSQRCDDAARREAVPVTRAYRFVFLRTERGVSVSGDER
jgi:hypothetical protein